MYGIRETKINDSFGECTKEGVWVSSRTLVSELTALQIRRHLRNFLVELMAYGLFDCNPYFRIKALQPIIS